MEIERKFLIRQLPENLDQFPHVEIEQAYLCTQPTVRIRRKGEDYILTIKEHHSVFGKGNQPIVNREEEFAIPAESYRHLLSKCDSGIVSKTRYLIDLCRYQDDGVYFGLTAELDVFHGQHKGLLMVEVEFPDTFSAQDFEIPSWFGEEVTSDPHYRNSWLAGLER